MKWIHYCSAYKIPFYIYKLQTGDAFIYKQKDIIEEEFRIILHGVIYLTKVFTNKEIVSLAILNVNDIISNITWNRSSTNTYYKAIALQKTYVISFTRKNFFQYNKFDPIAINYITKIYQKTLYKYELMTSITTHKYVKYRLIQLILILCQEFGHVEQSNILIPFEISQITLGIITGSNKITINKIIRKLCNEMLINYKYGKHLNVSDPFALSYCK